jgi:hypothetical protein
MPEMHASAKSLAPLILALSITCVATAQDAVPVGPNGGEQHAIDQLRAVAEAIKTCPPLDPSLGADMDVEGFADVYGPASNVVWNVELHPSIRARYIGSIEFSEPSYLKLPPDDSYCNKPRIDKKECRRMWLIGSDVSAKQQSHPFKFRYEFDVTPHGLEFLSAFTKITRKDGEPWVDGAIDSDGCAARSIKFVLSNSSVANPSNGISNVLPDLFNTAVRGDADAQLIIGKMYFAGTGVPQDYVEAYFWFDLAASGKSETMKQEDVAKLRDDAAAHLTPTLLLQTQERARKWSEDHQENSEH